MIERRKRRSLSSAGKIGKYQLNDPLRIQSDRSLFKSYDPFLDRNVVIKIIQLFDPNEEGDVENDTFYAEARAIGRLQHQNIVSVYDAGLGDFEGFLVMEFIEGKDLSSVLKNDKNLSLKEALTTAEKICHALAYAHSKKVIHRDLKPSNIMFSEEGNLKLVDFGLSVVQTASQLTMPHLSGSPSYMAPELICGEMPNEQSDLFSVAVILYEMISGELPFKGNDVHSVLYNIVKGEAEPIENKVEHLPHDLKSLFGKLLSKSPSDRFQTADKLEQELRTLQHSLDS
ncbi:MAG: serine/threonine-protein kinase [Pseudomonadota bacterium]